MGLMGCGGGLEPTFAPATPKTEVGLGDIVKPIKTVDIAGTYDVDSVTFATSPGAEPVALDHILRTRTVFQDGVSKDVQAKLDKAYLIIGPSGNFTFYYSIVDDKGLPIKVGPFDSGGIAGSLKTGIQEIGFVGSQSAAGTQITGLADEQETMYSITPNDKFFILDDVEDVTPTPHFAQIIAIKQK